jgi:hypothetical protein
MSSMTLVLLALALAIGSMIINTVQAYVERRAMKVFTEALELMVPVMEDVRRIEPHLDESVELAMIRTAELLPTARRMANGYVTPFGLFPRRKGS